MEEIFRSQFRLPAGLADKLRAAAEANNRSMNAEIVARLEQSFSPETSQPASFGYAVNQMLEWTMEKEKIDLGEALERLVAKGYSNDNSLPVLIFYAAPGMTAAEIRGALKEAELVTPPNSAVFFEVRRKKPAPKPTTP